MASAMPLAYSSRWLYQRCKLVCHALKCSRAQGFAGANGSGHSGALSLAILGLALTDVAHSLPGNRRPGVASAGNQKCRLEQTASSVLSAACRSPAGRDETPAGRDETPAGRDETPALSHPEAKKGDEKGPSTAVGTGRISSWLARHLKSSSTHADEEAMFDQVDRLCEEDDYETAMEVLERSWGDSPEHLWRRGRLAYQLAQKAPNKAERVRLVHLGYESLQRAIELDENNYKAHFWMVPLIHARADIDGIIAVLGVVPVMQRQMEILLRLNSQDPEAYFSYGMLTYNVSSVSWLEKVAASAVGYGLPNVSFEDARALFQRAEDISPRYSLLNVVMLGKTYYKLHDIEKARYYLEEGVNMTAKKETEIKAKEEAVQLLKKIDRSSKRT